MLQASLLVVYTAFLIFCRRFVPPPPGGRNKVKEITTAIPSRHKNSLYSPLSLGQFTSCRIIIDCTDIEVAKPGLMSHQNGTYSSYKGMNFFKVIIGVAPNAVIKHLLVNFMRGLSQKSIVKHSGLIN